MMDFEYYRSNRQNVFDINTKDATPFDFEGQIKRVYNNANLSVFVDDYCNADCKFCVAQLRYENAKKMYQKACIKDDDAYLRRLDEVLAYVAPLGLSISITGGEPTKSKRLVPILNLLDKHNIRKRTITSNGSGLFDEVDNKTHLDHLIDNGIHHLNISRSHYDEQRNKQIMKYKTGYCSNETLAEIIPYALNKGIRPRLSCILLKEGINGIGEMKRYIDHYAPMGIDNIIFRELMEYNPLEMINKEKMDYCQSNKVDLNNIWREVESDTSFTKFKNLLGYYYYVEIYTYNGITVASEAANLMTQKKEKEQNLNYIYEMVFHPNGNLNGSWVDSEEILLKY